MNEDTASIGPLPLTRVRRDALPATIAQIAAERHQPVLVYPLHITSINAARRDAQFVTALSAADVTYADGISVVALARLGGQRWVQKIAATDLAPLVIEELSVELGRPARVAVVGGEPGIAEAAGSTLASELPAEIVHTASGFPDDWDNEFRSLAASRPDVVLLGLGMPLEALVCARHRRALPNAVVVTCGGLLRILAGRERRAPRLFQRLELEWLYRAVTDPRRVWRRYLSGLLALSELTLRVLGARALKRRSA
jgi:N-acetylglucosaminyldiphosphoundecaprenol N-acetyl-beta-D-mannosaminyltransferase